MKPKIIYRVHNGGRITSIPVYRETKNYWIFGPDSSRDRVSKKAASYFIHLKDAEDYLKKSLAVKLKRLDKEYKKLTDNLLATRKSYDAVQEGIEGNEVMVTELLLDSNTLVHCDYYRRRYRSAKEEARMKKRQGTRFTEVHDDEGSYYVDAG